MNQEWVIYIHSIAVRKRQCLVAVQWPKRQLAMCFIPSLDWCLVAFIFLHDFSLVLFSSVHFSLKWYLYAPTGPAIFMYFFFKLSLKFWHLLILNCKQQQSHLLCLFSSAVQECPSDWSSIWSIAYGPCSKSVEAVYKSENTQETCQWVHVCRSDADIVYSRQCWSSSTDPIHPYIWY